MATPKLIPPDLQARMAEVYHDSRGHHQSESILEHTQTMLDKAIANKEGKLVLYCIELHDIGKINTRREVGYVPVGETKAATKIMYIGHEQESYKIAKELLKDSKLIQRDQDRVLKIVLNHMRMNRVRYEYSEERLVKLFGRVNFDEIAMRTMLKLSYYDCGLQGEDPLSSQVHFIIIESQHSLPKIPYIAKFASEGRLSLVGILTFRLRVNRILGLKDWGQRLKADVANYHKFSEEKLDEIYKSMIL